MIWLAWKLLTLPIRLVFLALRIVRRIVGFVGVSRIAAFAAGVGVGVSLPPETVEAAKARLAAPPGGSLAGTVGDELAAAVRAELAQSPRTWHLDQPTVTATGTRVTLSGTVPHATARGDLGRVAGAVVGVAAVDNQLTIEAAADGDEE